MASVAVYNGFGKYEEMNGEKGTTLKYGGLPFWFPFQKVAYLPDFTMREVNHAESSTGGTGEESVLTYKTFRVSGERLAEELLESQDLVKNSEKGFVVIKPENKKFKGSTVQVFAGVDEEGHVMAVDVQEIIPSQEEKDRAAKLAEDYKMQRVQEYFQSKRERMAGGPGNIFPTGNIRLYMDELGVKDIDDVTRHTSGNSGVEELLELLRAGANSKPSQVLTAGQAQVATAQKSISDLV